MQLPDDVGVLPHSSEQLEALWRRPYNADVSASADTTAVALNGVPLCSATALTAALTEAKQRVASVEQAEREECASCLERCEKYREKSYKLHQKALAMEKKAEEGLRPLLACCSCRCCAHYSAASWTRAKGRPASGAWLFTCPVARGRGLRPVFD